MVRKSMEKRDSHARPYARRALARLSLGVAGAFLLAFTAGVIDRDLSIQEGILALMSALKSSHPRWVAPLFFIVATLAMSLPLPGTRFIALLAGALFGESRGFLLSYGAGVLGASLCFLATRFLFAQTVRGWLERRHPRVAREVTAHGLVYVWSLRLTPLVPFAIANVALGLSGVSLRAYLLATALATAPYAYSYAAIGDGLQGALAGTIPPPWGALGLLALLSLVPVAYRIWRAAQNRARKVRVPTDSAIPLPDKPPQREEP